MTIASALNRIQYTGNGATTTFAVSFPFHAKTDLVVISTVIATGVQTVKTLTSDYTISGTLDALNHYTSGSVVFVVAPTSAERITIYRDPAKTQGLDLQDASIFPAENVEAQLDYLTMLIQRVSDLITRSTRQPDGDAANIGTLPSSVERASKFLAFDGNGDPIAAAGTSASLTPVSSFINTLLDDADAASARETLSTRTFNANVSNNFLSLVKTSVRTFDVSYESRTFNSGTSRNTIKISSNLPSPVPVWLDDYGFLHIGDLESQFPALSMNPTTGPAFRVLGDICIGDIYYFGSGATSGTGGDSVHYGKRVAGADPSSTLLYSGEALNVDSGNKGGAYIILHPDAVLSTWTSIPERGGVEIVAYGSANTTALSNSIRFATRSGANAIATRWYVETTGNFFPGTDNAYDIGEGARAVRTLYANKVLAGTSSNMSLGVAGSMATNAGSGYPCIPSCAGLPTGGPTPDTSTIPMIYDRSNNKIYFYNGSWRGVAVT